MMRWLVLYKDYFGYYVKTAAFPELHLTSRGLAEAPRLPTQQHFADTYQVPDNILHPFPVDMISFTRIEYFTHDKQYQAYNIHVITHNKTYSS